MAKREGSQGGRGGCVSLNLAHELINDIEIPHGKQVVDHPQIKHGAFYATALRRWDKRFGIGSR